MMKEWICLKCKSVFLAGASYARCCEEGVELFDPQKHAKEIVGLSNSWISIDKKMEKWEEHPLYKKVWQENSANGSNGAASIFIDFVDELIYQLGEQEINPPHIHRFDWTRSDGVEKCDCGIIKNE